MNCAGCGCELSVSDMQICASCNLEYCSRCIDDGRSEFCKDCATEARLENEVVL